jgi:disulfide bond formation protein DsbB
MIQTLNTIVSIGTILLQIVGAVLLFAIIFKKEIPLFSKKYLLTGFMLTLGATIISFMYSAGFGYEPCFLCWWARIFMFPQLIIFLVALIRKDSGAYWYSGALSILGVITSGYHVILENGGKDLLDCASEAVSCTLRYVFEFGYITIPVMSLTGFVVLLLLSIHQYRSTRK